MKGADHQSDENLITFLVILQEDLLLMDRIHKVPTGVLFVAILSIKANK